MSDDGTEMDQDAQSGARAGNVPHQPHHAGPQKSRLGCSCGGLAVMALFVLVFIGFISWLRLPFGNRGYGFKKDPRDQTRTLTQSIVNSIKGYYIEYSRYPVPEGFAGDETVPLRTDSFLAKVLSGQDTEHNPRHISFLPELKTLERGQGPGLLAKGNELWIVDKWGEPLYVIMDANFDGTIANPNPLSTTIRLNTGALVFSSGPDKDPNTWEDNIMSWESGKKTKRTGWVAP